MEEPDTAAGRDTARQTKLRHIWETMPFHALCGIDVTAWESDHVIVRLPYRDDLTNGAGTVHGGALGMLADGAATGAVVSGRSPDDRRIPVTTSLAMTFLAAASGDVEARARVTRRGRTTCFVQIEIVSDSRPVAQALATIQMR